MKKNKLLLMPIIATSIIAPVAMLTSCNQKSEAEKVADAIMFPLTKEQEKISDTYFEHLVKYNAQQRTNALIYDLFGLFNIKGWRGLPSDVSFTSLYKQQIVSITSNITKCSYETNSVTKELTVNLLGYVSFIFNNDYSVGATTYFRKDDYVMITYDIQNRTVKPDETNCSIKYEPSTSGTTECIGIIKERKLNNPSKLYYLVDVDTNRDYKSNDLPANYNNLVK